MPDSAPIGADRIPEVTQTSFSRWHRLFNLIVMFALATVALSLFLSHRFMQIYVDSVDVNQSWVERLNESSNLAQLASDVNAPGNDVFQSHKPDAEARNMGKAQVIFNDRLGAFQAELRAHVDPVEAEPLHEVLEAVRRAMQEMVGEAEHLFRFLKNQQTQQAGESMAAMDKRFAQLNRELESLRLKIRGLQNDYFEKQTLAAASLQRIQQVAAILITLMTVGALMLGLKLRRQVEWANQEKDRYSAALRESEAQLARRKTAQVRHDLLKKLMSAQEDERRRIARDLHDEIGQSLTSVLIGLRAVAEASTLDEARSRADELRQITVATIDEVRRLARGLRPSVLDDLGLVAALERYAADFAGAHLVAVDVVAPSDMTERLPAEIETALYRIVQESLTNTAKHSAATTVRVIIERQPTAVHLLVVDDGAGFDCQNTEADGGLGLEGMRERAALLEGRLEVTSQTGIGTTVSVWIPLGEDSDEKNSRARGG